MAITPREARASGTRQARFRGSTGGVAALAAVLAASPAQAGPPDAPTRVTDPFASDDVAVPEGSTEPITETRWWCTQGTQAGGEFGACAPREGDCITLAVTASARGYEGAGQCSRASRLWCFGSTRSADGQRVARCAPTETTCAAQHDALALREGWIDLDGCAEVALPERTPAAIDRSDLPDAPDAEDQPSTSRRRRSGAAEDFDRIGVLGAMSVGIEGCGQPLCSLIPIGGIGRFELGWRYKWVAPVVSLSIGGAPLDLPEDAGVTPDGAPAEAEAAMRFFDVGVGLQAFPITVGRIDPFFRLGVGYSRVALVAHDDDVEYRGRYSRGAVMLGGGLSIFVTPRVAVGPRFDAVLPFAGKFCADIEADDDRHDCTKIGDMVDEAETSVDERSIRKSLPKAWSFTVDARFVF